MKHHQPDFGITVTEIAAMDQPIDLSRRSRAAFIGRALRGPVNTPVLIDSFAAYTRRFGGLWHRSYMGYAVEQFFLHGGRELYIVRVANDAYGALLQLPSESGFLSLRAVEPGSTESLRIAVDYDGITDEEHFNLVVQRLAPNNGLVIDQEIFSGLSLQEDDPEFVANALQESSLVELQLPLPGSRPRATMGRGADTATPYVYPSERGGDGGELCDYDLIGSVAEQSGLFALNSVDEIDLLYLPLAGLDREPGPTALLAAELYCRKRAAMLIVDPPAAWEDARAAANGMRDVGFGSPNILSYFPRLDGEEHSRPAGGAIAGLLCKLDEHDGPWGDLSRRRYAFSRGSRPVRRIGEEESRLLHRAGMNVIAGNKSGGYVLHGGLTLGRAIHADRHAASLPLMRMCLAMGKTIERATRWAVFDPDRRHAAERVQQQVRDYMNALASIGAFADRPYSVQCEAQRYGANAADERGLTVLLSFQPVNATEQVSMTLYHTPSGCRIASTAFAPVNKACA